MKKIKSNYTATLLASLCIILLGVSIEIFILVYGLSQNWESKQYFSAMCPFIYCFVPIIICVFIFEYISNRYLNETTHQ